MQEQAGAARDVLVIDDDPAVLRGIARQLKDENLCLDSVSDPAEALRRIEKKRYDLVLCDVRMKPIGGLEVLQRIKNDSPELPVIIITGFVDDQLYEQARKFGSSGFLIKPVPKRKLIDTIHAALESAAEELRTSATRSEQDY